MSYNFILRRMCGLPRVSSSRYKELFNQLRTQNTQNSEHWVNSKLKTQNHAEPQHRSALRCALT